MTWMIAAIALMSIFAAMFVWASLHDQAVARQWEVRIENDRRAIIIAEEFGVDECYLTLDPDGLIVRAQPVDSDDFITFAPDPRSRKMIVNRDVAAMYSDDVRD